MKAFVKNVKDIDPVCPPGHENTDSWPLVTPKLGGSDAIEFAITEIRPGGAGHKDIHETSDHVFFFISGRAYAIVEGERFNVGPGDALFIPRNSNHEVHIEGKETLRLIAVSAPARKT